MGRKRLRILENVEITGIADKGKAVGRHGGKVVFVAGAVPGDLADVVVLRKKKGALQGEVEEMLRPSKDRVEPVCEHFGVCGGCKWQNLKYEAQLHHKRLRVEDVFTRIAKIPFPEIPPVIGAASSEYYRNKMEFSFSNKRWITNEEVEAKTVFEHRNALGFHRPRAFDKIVDVQHCHLQPDPSNAIRNTVRAFALNNDYTFFDIKEQKGLLRQLFVRTASTGEVMVIISFFYDDEEKRVALLDFIKERFPQITSLMYFINDKKNDSIFDLTPHHYAGNDFIYEELGHVKFKVGPKSFFQTNTAQAINLYNVIVDFADLKGTENVYDLYTGLGSIACYIADKCKKVVGIEEIEAAVKDAHENALLNKLDNVTFYAGDVKDMLDMSFVAKHDKPDLIITDPPRAGMHQTVIQTLLELAAPRIVYVSCNPATQARDLQLLDEDYKIVKIQPVDMFPHTHHIENVVLLEKK